ncbi:MAG: chitobiase/beta-hexosaminidase C-terminal domain-containing protein [Prevotella sp.]|nr:chitobiase/beta-hexosaminidase C-terminal domain-containing protein [Prevotella sp.]
MAKNTIAMEVNLRKNENRQNAGFGKYYLEVARKPTLSLKGFAQHMVDHGSIYSRDVIEGVLKKITQCLPELISQGVPVQLEPLGTFSPSLKNKKAGLTLPVLKSGNWDINAQVEGVKFNFLPYSVSDENLTSRKFKEEWCTLQLTDVIKSRKETVDGKEKRFVEKTPWETWLHDQLNGNGGNSGGSSQSGSGSNSGNSGNSGSQSQQSSVAAPTISGVNPFEETSQVSISGPDGATIYYSENGDDPDANDTLYTQPFTIDETTTIKAIAIKDGVSSQVTTKVFTKGAGGSGGFETGS